MKSFNILLKSLLLSILILSACQAQDPKQEDRLPAVSGSFYPSSATQLISQLEQLFSTCDKIVEDPPLAIIVPHAGYVFSGEVAASAYRQLERNRKYERIFVIGSSHTMYFQGASVYTQGDFITPLGKIKVDPLAAKLVKDHSVFNDNPDPHITEHSLEVQLPFLQYWLKEDFTIVPIVLGGESKNNFKKIASILKPWLNEKNLFVISTDFSHYPEYDESVKCDTRMAKAIISNSPEEFLKEKNRIEYRGIPNLVTAICGWTSVYTLLNMTHDEPDMEYLGIKYRNSGDSRYGEKDRVVGYHSICLVNKETASNEGSFQLNGEDKVHLLKIARNTLQEYLSDNRIPDSSKQKLSENLYVSAGAFVTLKADGRLRGCIGNFSAEAPLYQTVQQMAVAAAINDPRFHPVAEKEIEGLEIEISVLTPMKKISDIREIELGRHGIYIKKGHRSGTFLPQVADETGWTLEEFLGHCSQDKAGLGWEGWKSAEVFTYEAIVFNVKEFNL